MVVFDVRIKKKKKTAISAFIKKFRPLPFLQRNLLSSVLH